MVETLTDGQLARGITSSFSSSAGRDRDAEGELCRRFAPRIRLYGLRHLGDEDRARDLEVLVACQHHFAAFPTTVVIEVRATHSADAPLFAKCMIPHTFEGAAPT